MSGSREKTEGDRVPDRLGDLALAQPGIDDNAARRFGGSNLEIGLAQGRMEAEIFGLEPIGSFRSAPLRRPRQSDVCRKVEDQGEIGADFSQGDVLERVEKAGIQPAQSLISARRIGKPVADDPGARGEGGRDLAVDVIDPRGGKEDGFRLRSQVFDFSGEQEVAQRLGAWRTARLARRDSIDTGASQPLDEARDLGRFSDPFPAFQRDEASALYFGVHFFRTYLRKSSSAYSRLASMARRESDPTFTSAAVCNGTSST